MTCHPTLVGFHHGQKDSKGPCRWPLGFFCCYTLAPLSFIISLCRITPTFRKSFTASFFPRMPSCFRLTVSSCSLQEDTSPESDIPPPPSSSAPARSQLSPGWWPRRRSSLACFMMNSCFRSHLGNSGFFSQHAPWLMTTFIRSPVLLARSSHWNVTPVPCPRLLRNECRRGGSVCPS